MVVGVAYAELHFIADRLYTEGANNLVLSKLQQAADLFPLDSYYRLGPAQLIIRDNIWYSPKEALLVLYKVQKHEPYSRFLAAWIELLENKAKVMGTPMPDVYGETRSELLKDGQPESHTGRTRMRTEVK